MAANDELRLLRQVAAAKSGGDARAELAAMRELDAYYGQTKQESGTGGERFALGAKEALLGIPQLAARALPPLAGQLTATQLGGLRTLDASKIETPMSRAFRESPGYFDELARQLEARQEAIAPEDFDVARLAGNIAGLAPGGLARAPAAIATRLAARPLTRAAVVGASAGGLAAGALPVTGEDFATEKAKQITIGTAGGFALGPMAVKAGEWIARSGRAALTAVQKATGRVTPQINVLIDDIVKREGFDPKMISQALRDELADQIRTAGITGTVPAKKAIGTAAAFDIVGAKGTKGQITQDLAQFQKEIGLLKSSPELQGQFQQTLASLNQRLNQIQGRSVPKLLDVEAGRNVMQALEAAYQPVREETRRLYAEAVGAYGGQIFINTKKMATSSLSELDKTFLTRTNIPKSAISITRDLAKRTKPLTVLESEGYIQRINGLLKGNPDSKERLALKILKSNLDDSIDDAGTQAGETFKLARDSHRRAKALEENIPALKMVLEGEAIPDHFMAKFVYNAPVDDLTAMVKFLSRTQPEARKQIKGQIIGDLIEAAQGGPEALSQFNFNGAKFRNAYSNLKQSGKAKIFFNDSELSMLNAVERVSKAVQVGPTGQIRTGLGEAERALGLLSKVFNRVGGVSLSAVSAVTGPVVRGTQAYSALRPPQFITARPPPVIPRDILAGGAGVVAGQATNE